MDFTHREASNDCTPLLIASCVFKLTTAISFVGREKVRLSTDLLGVSVVQKDVSDSEVSPLDPAVILLVPSEVVELLVSTSSLPALVQALEQLIEIGLLQKEHLINFKEVLKEDLVTDLLKNQD